MNWTVGIGMIGVMALGGISPVLIDRAIENSLKKNFGPFKKLEVQSQTDFMSLLNGKVDGLSVKAGNFQVDGLPVQRMDIRTGAMRFDTWSALRGQARWLNEIEATASGVLDEPAINSLITRPFVQNQLKKIKVNLPMAETAAIE
ncbi:MAG TPA: LmeA family phospholipid-binding protein, partial [Chroococcales cyanobacterium]